MIVVSSPCKRNAGAKLLATFKMKIARPVIGSLWNGKPQQFVDTHNGVFWQSSPTLTDTEIRIQSAILDKKKPALWVDPRMVIKKDTDESTMVKYIETMHAHMGQPKPVKRPPHWPKVGSAIWFSKKND